jgi:hypothetical protein
MTTARPCPTFSSNPARFNPSRSWFNLSVSTANTRLTTSIKFTSILVSARPAALDFLPASCPLKLPLDGLLSPADNQGVSNDPSLIKLVLLDDANDGVPTPGVVGMGGGGVIISFLLFIPLKNELLRETDLAFGDVEEEPAAPGCSPAIIESPA